MIAHCYTDYQKLVTYIIMVTGVTVDMCTMYVGGFTKLIISYRILVSVHNDGVTVDMYICTRAYIHVSGFIVL